MSNDVCLINIIKLVSSKVVPHFINLITVFLIVPSLFTLLLISSLSHFKHTPSWFSPPPINTNNNTPSRPYCLTFTPTHHIPSLMHHPYTLFLPIVPNTFKLIFPTLLHSLSPSLPHHTYLSQITLHTYTTFPSLR